ncbi:DUF3080 domain-containing protein [Enterovibrio sp. ZSDZ42]|uniref:DUF3080 domain-containing protein n=1 Tax=Enterovibrio gelatinilyticus TaxID=2899819 RepID=A0ABT5QU31_9GAMM|nr:DUF3080 domain-containing protein [Enterovibrio sp. ZSDZ42]MDD1791522.1 DUF3080 domain-containing protein [Enterovibrio sp. ZSDZ42]
MLRLLTITLLAHLLSGCFGTDPAVQSFDTYQQRLANVVDTDPLLLQESIFIALPRKRDAMLPIDDVRMGLFDAYELRQCGLFQLIAERNSILGKVQDAFHQLDYEIQLLNTLAGCLSLIEDPTLIELLEDIQEQKNQQFARVYWNTLIGSDAWRKQLTPPSTTLITPDTPFPHSEALLAIHRYSEISHANLTNMDVIALQESIEKQRYLGALFYSMDESTRWLNTITQQLKRDDALVICGANRNQTKLNYVRNVFDTFFIGAVQPYLSKLNSLYLDAQPSLDALHRQVSATVPNSDFNSAYFGGEHYRRFQTSVKDHVSYWQTLFARCQMEIGNSIKK